MDPLHQIFLLIIVASLLFAAIGYLRARGRRAAGYVALLAAALGATLFAAYRDPALPWLVYLCYALFGYLVLVPSVLISLIRRALRRGDWRQARLLARLRTVSQPGAGAGRDLRALSGLTLVSEGRVDEATAEAREQLAEPMARKDALLRLALLEHLLTLLGYGRRYEESVELFEGEGGTSLASASVGICVAMVRAYAEVGALERSARCLAILEESPAALHPGNAPTVNGARVAFVAHLGLTGHLERILGIPPVFLPGLRPEHVGLWRGLALARSGERDRAEAELRAVVEEAGDPRVAEVAGQRLAEDLDRQLEPGPELCELAELSTSRAETYRGVPRSEGRFWRLAPVSAALLAVVVAVHVAAAVVGDIEDPWLLLRFGANFRLAVLAGEPWRLVTSMFLHGGMIHLLFNVYALFLLGRLVEQMLGSLRFFCVYFLAGVCGSAASAYYGGPQHLSVGASGAIFGLVGAALVGLRQLRGQVPEEWRKRLSYNLLVIIALNIFIGFSAKHIDNAAHIGGLLGGALFALLLPGAREGGSRRGLVPLAALLLCATVASGVAAALSSPRVMLERMPRQVLRQGGLAARVPVHWTKGKESGMLAARDPLVALVQPPTLELRAISMPPTGSLAELAAEDLKAARDEWSRLKQVERVEVLAGREQPWAVRDRDLQLGELRLVVDGHRYINTNIYRRQGDLLLVARIYLPEHRLGDYASVLGEIARSIKFSD